VDGGLEGSGSDPVIVKLEALPRRAVHEFLEVPLPQEGPFRFLFEGLKEFLDRDEALFIEDQTELVGAYPQHVA
jgi:hypothetical protein